MNILLFGKNGQVGSHLCETLKTFGAVTALGRSDVDLCEPGEVEKAVLAHRFDVVINAAAYTAVDKAESEVELAMAVNGTAPGVMARTAEKVGAIFVHYSTDYVFDGLAGDPYMEDAATHPTGVYGRSKLAGEKAVEEVSGRHLIFRTAWVYSLHGHNFLKTMLRLAGERDELRVVDDQIGSPTFAGAIAAATATVLACLQGQGGLRPGQGGIYHMTCQGATSWHGFTKSILEKARINGVRVVPIATADYPTAAARPAYSVLSNDKLKERFGVQLPTWGHALSECLAGWKLAQQR